MFEEIGGEDFLGSLFPCSHEFICQSVDFGGDIIAAIHNVSNIFNASVDFKWGFGDFVDGNASCECV